MASRVEVQFGASVGELKSAVDDVNESLDSIKSHVESVADGFAALAGIAGAALSFEGLKTGFQDLATFADSVQNAQARMGGTLESMTTLSGIAALTGVSFQSLEHAVEAANLQVQKSTSDAYGPASQGLKALGLSARELTGIPVDQFFGKVADAVSRFNPSLTLTSNVQQAFGRGMAELMPLLLQGSEGFEEMRAAVEKAQSGLSAALPGISETEQKLNLLSLRSRAFAASVFSTLKPAIDAAIDAFSNLTASISADRIRDAANSIANSLVDIAASVARFFVNLGATFDGVTSKFDYWIEKYRATVAEVQAIGNFFGNLTGQSTSQGVGAGGGDAAAHLTEQFAGIEAAAKRAHDAINSAIPASGSWAAMAQDLARLNQETLGAAEGFTKLNAVAADNGVKERASAQIEAVNAEIAAADRSYQQQVEKINSSVKSFQVGEGQKTQLLLAALDQRHTAEMIALAEESEIRGLSAKQYQKMLDDEAKLDQKYAADRQKILDQELQNNVKQWQGILQPIVAAWDSQLKGLLSGTESWGQAMKNIFSSLVLDAIKNLEKLAVEKAAAGLATSIGAGPQSALGSLLGLGGSAAQTANTTAVTALTAAVTANTVALGGETVATTTATAAETASSAGGIAGLFKSFMAFLPAFDTGSWNLPQTTMAIVHQGEMIVPASAAPGVRQVLTGGGAVAGGGGGNVSINVSAIDGASVQRFFQQNGQQIARSLGTTYRSNPSLVPA